MVAYGGTWRHMAETRFPSGLGRSGIVDGQRGDAGSEIGAPMEGPRKRCAVLEQAAQGGIWREASDRRGAIGNSQPAGGHSVGILGDREVLRDAEGNSAIGQSATLRCLSGCAACFWQLVILAPGH